MPVLEEKCPQFHLGYNFDELPLSLPELGLVSVHTFLGTSSIAQKNFEEYF